MHSPADRRNRKGALHQVVSDLAPLERADAVASARSLDQMLACNALQVASVLARSHWQSCDLSQFEAAEASLVSIAGATVVFLCG